VNHNALGSILAQTGDITNAISHFESALRINPGLASANRNMATALVHHGRVEEAKVYLRKATASTGNILPTRSF
jgi:Flp pilus assembly protein TadD